MSSSTAKTSADNTREPIAPWWHTVLVLVPIAVGSVASAYQHGLPNADVPGVSSRLSSYITVLVQEWCVVLLIWLALKRQGFRTCRRISCCRSPADRNSGSSSWGRRQ